jgi:hypothetical protein
MTHAGLTGVAFMKTETFLVLLGLDEDNKPRAAKFDEKYENAARKAAVAKGYKIGRPKTDEAVGLASRLVDGKVFASGKSLVPLANVETYKKLLEVLEIEAPAAAPATPALKAVSPATSGDGNLWARIAIGTIVLCQDDSAKPKERGWWESRVTSISNDGKILTVRWSNYPTIKPFTVKRAAVAILPVKG